MLDSDTISSWLRIKNSGISIDKDAAADYISNMANKYNTIYVPRTFHTSLGTDVTVLIMNMDTGSIRMQS